MSKTISSTYASGFTLTTATSPLVVTSAGVISRTSGSTGAIYGAAGKAWTVTNYGQITGNGLNLAGIALGGFASTVTNAVIINNAGGVISGQSYAILVNGHATVTNESGATLSTSGGNEAVYLLKAATVTNYGLITNSAGGGLYLQGGGSVINGAGGTIAAATDSSNPGVRLEAAGTVTNAGTIIGGSEGAILFAVNSTSDRLIVDPGAVFTGGVYGGTGTLELASAASAGTLATVSATGFTNFSTLAFDSGSSWTVKGNSSSSGLGTVAITGFTSTDTIDLLNFAAVSETFAGNALTLTNSATQHATLHIQGAFTSSEFQRASYNGGSGTEITFGTSSIGLGHTLSGTYTSTVTLTSPTNNPLTVLSSGKVVPASLSGGYGGLYGKGGANQAWTITNSGLINDGTNGNGIQLGQGGTYVGASTISNQTGGTIIGAYGIRMYNTVTSSITNQSGGTIEATSNRGIYFDATGSLTNYGVITAPALTNQRLGVLMESGGVLINGATGTISGYGGVILIGSSTLTNAGTIEAVNTSAFAVRLGSAGGSKLIADPGAVFFGQVYGGNGTLELASAAGAGTLAATGFTNFTAIDFDAGSEWTIAGSTTALSGAITGFTSNETIDLTGFVATSATYASGVLTLTNTISAHETLHFSGGGLQTSNFHLAGDGGTGTDITDVAPTSISAPPSYQGLAQGGSNEPFASVQVTDANPGAMDTVTVALASPADGTLSDVDGGIFDPSTDVFLVSGTPAQVNTALANLVFLPATPSGGDLHTTTLTIDVTGTGGSVSASTNVTSVEQVLGLATIATDNLVISVSPDGTGFAPVTGGKSYEAVVLGPTVGGVYQLPSGYVAEFLGGTASATLSDPSGGNAVLAGNAGTDTISSGAANDTIIAGGGSATTVEFTSTATDGWGLGAAGSTVTFSDAGAQDSIAALGAALAQVTASGTGAVVFGGTGCLTASVAGAGTILVGGSGAGTTSATIAGSASVTAVYGGTDILSVVDQGLLDTVAAFGASSANVTISGAGALVFGGTGNLTASVAGAGNILVGGSGTTSATIAGSELGGAVYGGTDSLSVMDQGSEDTIAAFGASSANVTTSGGYVLVFGGTGSLTASVAGSDNTVVGGSSTTSATIAGSASGAAMFGGTGSLSVVDQGTLDTVAAFGATSANVTTSGTEAVVFGGTGSLTAWVAGSGNTVVGGSGTTSATIAGSGSGAVVLGGTDTLSVVDRGTNDTVAAFGASSAAVTVTGTNDLLFGGSGPVSVAATGNGSGDTIVGGSGAMTVTAGVSNFGLVVFASSSPLNFVGNDGGAIIVGGSGAESVTGGAGGITLFGSAGGDITYNGSGGGVLYQAGTGNETLDASGATTSDVLFGGNDAAGQDTILGGSGNDTMVAGTGNEMLAGGSGDNVFAFASVVGAAPLDVVTNFTSGDAILLMGYAPGVAAAALASATSSAGSITITLSDSTTINFAGIANVNALEGHIFGG